MNKFNKKLRTSKREQGIITLKSPRFKKWANGTLRCHCLFRGKSLWEKCWPHIYQERNQQELNKLIEQMKEENEKNKKLDKNNQK